MCLGALYRRSPDPGQSSVGRTDVAVRTYLEAWGYGAWHAWREYSGDAGVQAGLFVPLVTYPVRPTGVLVWRGRFLTPTYGPTDSRLTAVQEFLESVLSVADQMSLPVPTDQRYAGSSLGETITVQPRNLQPGVRDSRGVTAGWTCDWLEVI